MTTATLVETHKLFLLVVVGLAAGVGVTGVYGVLMFGALRSAELRREGRAAAAGGAAALAAAAFVLFAGAIAYGIYLLTNKS